MPLFDVRPAVAPDGLFSPPVDEESAARLIEHFNSTIGRLDEQPASAVVHSQ